MFNSATGNTEIQNYYPASFLVFKSKGILCLEHQILWFPIQVQVQGFSHCSGLLKTELKGPWSLPQAPRRVLSSGIPLAWPRSMGLLAELLRTAHLYTRLWLLLYVSKCDELTWCKNFILEPHCGVYAYTQASQPQANSVPNEWGLL